MSESHIILRPEVQWFAEQMEIKLRENDWKGGWKGESVSELTARIEDETVELWQSIMPHAQPVNIVREAVDVANFAMMVADRVREYLPPDQSGLPSVVHGRRA